MKRASCKEVGSLEAGRLEFRVQETMKWIPLIDLTFIKSHNVHIQTIRIDPDSPTLSHGK